VLSGDAEEGLWARDEAAVHETRVRAKRMYFNCMGEGGSGERLVVRVPPQKRPFNFFLITLLYRGPSLEKTARPLVASPRLERSGGGERGVITQSLALAPDGPYKRL
jgi:hypothetical protein